MNNLQFILLLSITSMIGYNEIDLIFKNNKLKNQLQALEEQLIGLPMPAN